MVVNCGVPGMVIFICLAIEVTEGAGGAPIGSIPAGGVGEADAEAETGCIRFELISVELAICELKY